MAGKNEVEYIKLEALSLGMDETTYDSLCPFCPDGGESGSFSLTRITDGILFNCFRDKCGASGRVPIHSSSLDYQRTKEKGFEPKYFNYPLTVVPMPLRKTLRRKYGLLDEELNRAGFRWAPDHGRVYMPVRGTAGQEIGAQLRSYDERERSKTLNYRWDDSEPFVHNPGVAPSIKPGGPLVLVEDIISSIRTKRFADSVALLGTNLSPNVARILCSKYRHVVLALDPDAYPKAMKMWRDYALFFETFNVVKLPKDPKDMLHDDLESCLTDNWRKYT